jgi:hypothetical protein
MRAVQQQLELLPNFELGRRRRLELGSRAATVKLAELQPQYNAGNLSTPPGDNLGLRLLGRWTAQLEVPLLEKLYPYAMSMRKLVCAHKVVKTILIMGMINCESSALAMLRLMLSTRRCRHPQAFERKHSFETKP